MFPIGKTFLKEITQPTFVEFIPHEQSRRCYEYAYELVTCSFRQFPLVQTPNMKYTLRINIFCYGLRFVCS